MFRPCTTYPQCNRLSWLFEGASCRHKQPGVLWHILTKLDSHVKTPFPEAADWGLRGLMLANFGNAARAGWQDHVELLHAGSTHVQNASEMPYMRQNQRCAVQMMRHMDSCSGARVQVACTHAQMSTAAAATASSHIILRSSATTLNYAHTSISHVLNMGYQTYRLQKFAPLKSPASSLPSHAWHGNSITPSWPLSWIFSRYQPTPLLGFACKITNDVKSARYQPSMCIAAVRVAVP